MFIQKWISFINGQNRRIFRINQRKCKITIFKHKDNILKLNKVKRITNMMNKMHGKHKKNKKYNIIFQYQKKFPKLYKKSIMIKNSNFKSTRLLA